MNKLNCSVQKYGWGRRGVQSKVAVYKKANDDTFQIDENEAYAELWMGTHPNGPSTLDGSNVSLSDYLKTKQDEAIGSKISAHFYAPENETKLGYGDLPFLFKVLSINQALSIQAHPNKTLAKVLRQKDPKNYPDANHKPEMLIAISDIFEAMCGFRLPAEIADNFKNYPELADLCSKENVDLFLSNHSETALRECFSSMMNRNDEFIRDKFESLKNRLSVKSNDQLSYLDTLYLRLAGQYPNDVGCFSVYLLNCLKLKKGEAIFLSANVPHAYLFGDGVECMACSDNVVRAGLTPKFKDVNVLCEMLDYSMRSIDENILSSTKIESSIGKDYLIEYRPSVDEFSLQQIKIEATHLDQNLEENTFLIPKNESGSILILIKVGCAESYFQLANGNKVSGLKTGYVYFIDSLVDVHFKVPKAQLNGTALLAYRAFCDIKSNKFN